MVNIPVRHTSSVHNKHPLRTLLLSFAVPACRISMLTAGEANVPRTLISMFYYLCFVSRCFEFKLTSIAAYLSILATQIHFEFSSLEICATLLYSFYSPCLFKLFPYTFSMVEGCVVAQLVFEWLSAFISSSINIILRTGLPDYLIINFISADHCGTSEFKIAFILWCLYSSVLLIMSSHSRAASCACYPLIIVGTFRLLYMLSVAYTPHIRPLHIYLVVCWAVLVLIALLFALVIYVRKVSVSCIHRKMFHVLGLVVTVTGLDYCKPLLDVCATCGVMFAVMLEVSRTLGGGSINGVMDSFANSKDTGAVILSHIYLLVGLNIGSFPPFSERVIPRISDFAGVLSLGVGDTFAAVGGKLFGRTWISDGKTWEGVVASVLSQFVFLLFRGEMCNGRVWVAVVVNAYAEGALLGDDIDNLLLPLITYPFL